MSMMSNKWKSIIICKLNFYKNYCKNYYVITFVSLLASNHNCHARVQKSQNISYERNYTVLWWTTLFVHYSRGTSWHTSIFTSKAYLRCPFFFFFFFGWKHSLGIDNFVTWLEKNPTFLKNTLFQRD